MTESEFLALAEAVLAQVEAAVEGSDVDIDCERSGNVLTLEFEDGSKIIVNLQTPMSEIWIAARSGGYHYRLKGDKWRDTRDDSELFEALSRFASEQAGETVTLSAD
ncbi:iron donor protein CyaY [Pandoraea nosoerga]|uniref:Iron-sulfur cluster assembly protein CyaY n=1 Tax=Pandoraea nosoerga TaxID=2508296 RepID=A0A5E4VM96_9BURK|nr:MULTISPECIES: iron donor protein CyaY [Pandoraea]MBN4666822.1 iron donor protein CyaY [Pandoraea nosoerga]MBN4677557.1 iron donor protein CyaY [Pandoraea nosoerga]MBN4682393.1 iron donor protein CyaY [Pandoraea nosoerga]MBN4746063.1 iron donor protein CyaY [Pandoraea nosoerga]VVE13033.1 iron donor protein CyaY [Pandoraea nosoerga]